MNSPKFVSLLIVPGQPNPVRLVTPGETLRDVESAGVVAWRAQSQLGGTDEPPMWDTYVRVREVATVLREIGLHRAGAEEELSAASCAQEESFPRGSLAAYHVAEDLLSEVLR